MTMWRPVSGDIYGLDAELFNEEAFQEFFREERVLARGHNVENGHYEIELAVTGRRRRVAVLDADGYVIPGMPLSELVDTMDQKLRKVQIVIEDEIRYGDINLGSVAPDVEADIAVFEEGLAGVRTPEDAADDSDEEDAEELPDAPLLMISDLALAEVPAIAAVTKVPMAVMPHGNVRVLVAAKAVDVKKMIFPRPVYHLTLRTQGDDAPLLTLGLDNQRLLSWTWEDQLPVMDWMTDYEAALEFADENLGAGAIARRCVLEIDQGSAGDVRRALLSSKTMGPAFFVQAMGLGPEILDVLEGRLDVAEIPDAEVFKQANLSDTIRQVVALEISGHGVATPKLWENYRKLYLGNPGLMSATAAIQAALGGSVFVGALQAKGKKARWGAGLGAFLMVNSISRVLTTHYIQESLEHSEAVRKLTEAAAEEAREEERERLEREKGADD